MSAAASVTSITPIPALKRRGMMLVLASPPGGGKTTISRAIMARDPNTVVSVSATTRDMRPGEVDGTHYYFVDHDKFKGMIASGEMLEHALVYNGHYYGTPKAPVEAALNAGKDVMFDIDWQGMQQLQKIAPKDVVGIFILPPSWDVLESRLRGRATDSEDEIRRRLAKAADEISHYKEFDYIVVNHDLEDSIAKVRAIMDAERAKRHRHGDIHQFVETLKPA